MTTSPEQSLSPTDRWLAVAELPPLTGPAGTAERLMMLLHYSIDWDGWVGARRQRYWDAILPDRVVLATYRADHLRRWWSEIAEELNAQPRGEDERAELAGLLEEPALPVLTVLREQNQALILRTRIVTDAVRTSRTPRSHP